MSFLKRLAWAFLRALLGVVAGAMFYMLAHEALSVWLGSGYSEGMGPLGVFAVGMLAGPILAVRHGRQWGRWLLLQGWIRAGLSALTFVWLIIVPFYLLIVAGDGWLTGREYLAVMGWTFLPPLVCWTVEVWRSAVRTPPLPPAS